MSNETILLSLACMDGVAAFGLASAGWGWFAVAFVCLSWAGLLRMYESVHYGNE